MNKKRLIGVSMIAGSILAGFVFLWPYYDAIREVQDGIETKELAVIKKKKFIEKITDTRKQIEAKKEDLNKVELLISSGKHAENVTVNLETIIREAGVTISDFKMSAAKSGSEEDFEVMQIQLTTSGQYSAIFNLIRLLEKNLRIFDIQELNIARKEGDNFAVPLSVTIKMNTYYLK